jgi:hypothetical protein
MEKAHKTIIISSIIFLLVLVGGIYGITSYIHNLNTKQQLSTELQFAKDSQLQVRDKPFLSKLPIITNQYSIYYNSLNNEINIVFSKNDQDINILKNIYETQILTVLQNIGVNTQKEKIVWLKQQ